MKKKKLIILRGCSGSGKSTLVASLTEKSVDKRVFSFSTDDFFVRSDAGDYEFVVDKLQEAHQWNMNRCAQACADGLTPIVIDNTNLEAFEAGPYVRMGLAAGYKIEIQDTQTPWRMDALELSRRNKHGVPLSTIRRQISRYQYYSVRDAEQTPLPFAGRPPVLSLLNQFPFVSVDEPQIFSRVLAQCAASFLLSGLLHWTGRGIIMAAAGAGRRRCRHLDDPLYVAECLPSTAHGLVLGSVSLYHVLHTFNLSAVEPFPRSLELAMCYAVGYSLWDMGVMIRHGDRLSMYVHHLVTASGAFLMAGVYRQLAYFPTAFGISELTVLPQNLIYLNSKFGHPRHRRLLVLVRLLFFLPFRTFLLPVVVQRWLRMRKRERSSLRKVPKLVKQVSILNVCLLSALNTYWTVGCFKALFS